VRDSDGTLILVQEAARGGTALTIEEARQRGKPLLEVKIQTADSAAIREWVQVHDITVLNVAGPRASESPGIYAVARRLITQLLEPAG
jgi:hypothetical protein